MRPHRRPWFAWLGALMFVAVLTLGSNLATLAQTPPALPRSVFELIQVAEDVYSFRYANHITMFIVTSEGVITADPLGMQNAQAPNLLKTAIGSVTDQPVKYVVITHWGADHGMGGAVFSDTAQFISHPLTAERIAQANNSTTPVPTLLVTDQLTVELGGKTVHVRFAGIVHADDYLLIHYPARNIIFTVDFIRKNEAPFGNFATGNVEEWVRSLDRIEALPFETILLGHPPAVAGRDALREHRQYLIDLMDAIRAARAAGHADNSPEMIAFVRDRLAPAYGQWTNFNNRLAMNIAGAIRTMSPVKG